MEIGDLKDEDFFGRIEQQPQPEADSDHSQLRKLCLRKQAKIPQDSCWRHSSVRQFPSLHAPTPASKLAAQCTWAPCRVSRLLQQGWAHLRIGPGGRTTRRLFPESVPAGRHPDPGRVFRGECCFGTKRNRVNKVKGSLPRPQRTPVAARSLAVPDATVVSGPMLIEGSGLAAEDLGRSRPLRWKLWAVGFSRRSFSALLLPVRRASFQSELRRGPLSPRRPEKVVWLPPFLASSAGTRRASRLVPEDQLFFTAPPDQRFSGDSGRI